MRSAAGSDAASVPEDVSIEAPQPEADVSAAQGGGSGPLQLHIRGTSTSFMRLR